VPICFIKIVETHRPYCTASYFDFNSSKQNLNNLYTNIQYENAYVPICFIKILETLWRHIDHTELHHILILIRNSKI